MRPIYCLYLLLLIIGSLGSFCAEAQKDPASSPATADSRMDLMPVPRKLETRDQRLAITDSFRISITGHPDNRLYAEASRFIRRLSEKTGFFWDRQGYLGPRDTSATASLLINVDRPGKLNLYQDESYHIEINGRQVLLNAATDLGAIHGLETLLQLVNADRTGYFFPGLSISDGPRFAWRGLLLDVALHFMPVDEIKRTLDGMAAVKLNVLHLHACNDQGFRVESKIFPRLQQMASDGLYYTQQDIQEIIRYAGQRGIRVVPEFVVPAHTTAILTAYPELASVKRKYTLQRYFGVFDPVLDPTNEKVYVFLDKLFSEMAGLFPDTCFHIGGDENTGRDWEQTPSIRAFMTAHGMKTFMDLQTWFNRRIQPILRKNGKIMMGWDEILQPGIPKDVIIQSWRGNEAYYKSVRQGYRAILSYGYYIDLIQPASYHYQNDPIPDSISLTAAETKNILGGEATMWSELVNPETVDSRIWPRTAAIAERLWSPATIKDTDDMYRRLDLASLRLDALGLRHESYKPVMLRRLTGSWNTQPLEILADVLEPLKIYERNQGDTLYTVFSPLTKLADLAVPDQRTPRTFNRLVDNWIARPSPEQKEQIVQQLTLWKDNDTALRKLLARSPVLQEAAPLSASLSALAAAGIEALQFIQEHTTAGADWRHHQSIVIAKAKEQSGRCELQVVSSIQKLIDLAAGSN